MGDYGAGSWCGFAGSREDVAPVDNPLYTQECGCCHFAYQPGLLPAATWAQIMQGLADHIGENAEFPNTEVAAINDCLTANAADRAAHSRFAGIGRSMREGSLRIALWIGMARGARARLLASVPVHAVDHSYFVFIAIV